MISKRTITKSAAQITLLLILFFSISLNTSADNDKVFINVDKVTVTPTTAKIDGHLVILPGAQNIPSAWYTYHFKGGDSNATILASRGNLVLGSTGFFSHTISGLIKEKLYTYSITDWDGTNTSVATVTTNGQFTTTASGTQIIATDVPAVTTKEAINIYVDQATVKGHAFINDNSAEVYFKYGTDPLNSNSLTIDPSNLNLTSEKGINFQDGDFAKTLGGLTENQTYYFMACAKNSIGESCDATNMKFFTPVITNDIPNSPSPGDTETDYYPLATLPGVGETCAPDPQTGQTVCVKTTPSCTTDPVTGIETCTNTAFGTYLNRIITIVIGIAAILAMIMIIMGGIQYMTSELGSGKEAGRERITNAVLGLLIALGAFALLNTINPQLLNVNFGLQSAKVTIEGDKNTPFVPLKMADLVTLGIQCPGNAASKTEAEQDALRVAIGKSFINKSTYNMDKRGSYDATKNTAYLDCSSYISQIQACMFGPTAPSYGNYTGNMMPHIVTSIEGTKVNGKELTKGDLLGWRAGESIEYPGFGHVVMYIGNGQIIEAHGPKEKLNQAVSIRSLDHYKTEITRGDLLNP